MLDLFNFRIPQNADVQVFKATSTSASNQTTYLVPRGKSMLYIYAIGGGGGGGGGFSRAAGSAGGGGGGGGSSAVSTLLVPIVFLPDILHVYVGNGGIGGTPTGATAGALSYVSIYPEASVATNLLILASPGTAGSAGTATASGGNGSGGAATIAASAPLGGLGIFLSTAGQNGTNGGAHTGANGAVQVFPTTGINVMGGGGGAGCTTTDFQGNDHTSITSSLISEQRPRGGAGTGVSGSSSNTFPASLFYNYGGCGGGSNNTGTAGNGGHGGYGCGGGGGGAGTTGGRGGNGGAGLVIMIAW